MRLMPLLFVLTLTACAAQATRHQQIAAWHRCIDQTMQAHQWLSACS